MKNFIVIAIFVSLLGCNKVAVDNAADIESTLNEKDADLVQELIAIELPEAYEKQDTVKLKKFLNDKYQLIDDNGDAYSKAHEVEYAGNYGPSYNEFEFKIEAVNLFDNGVAMVSGEGIMKGENEFEAYITTYTSSNTLIKKAGKWEVISTHVSGVKEETFPIAPN